MKLTDYADKLMPEISFPSDQKGSALFVCMLVLVVLTTLGLLSVQTSVTESKIAINEQRWEQDFNLSEGGAAKEGSNVGFAKEGSFEWYQISDPDESRKPLFPPTKENFDPGSDIDLTNTTDTDPSEYFNKLDDKDKMVQTAYWPRQNMANNKYDNNLDFAYLVTYVGGSDKMIKGYDAGKFSSYRFRVNGAKQIVVELGGIKIGVKSM